MIPCGKQPIMYGPFSGGSSADFKTRTGKYLEHYVHKAIFLRRLLTNAVPFVVELSKNSCYNKKQSIYGRVLWFLKNKTFISNAKGRYISTTSNAKAWRRLWSGIKNLAHTVQ